MYLDVIGDVHGHADALEALLSKLDYAHRGGAWRHPDGRRAVFVGDLIDRGPRQCDTVKIARDMIEAGSGLAIMGNHEFNAVAYATPDPAEPGLHCRPRRGKNIALHAAFIEAVGGADGAKHHEHVDFFRELPLWLDFEGLRIVHACWSQVAIDALRPHLDADNRLTESGFHASFAKGSTAYAATEILLKGPEMTLPGGLSYRDAQGIVRTRTRTRWWDEAAVTIRAACVEASVADLLGEDPLPEEAVIALDASKPVLFGHYWLRGVPHLLSPERACLDFSVAKGGVLCAYRYDGEARLDPDKLVWVG